MVLWQPPASRAARRPRIRPTCPAHEDQDPSLSIRDADDGQILVHCHAGCDQSLVIGELRSRGFWGGRPDTEGGVDPKHTWQRLPARLDEIPHDLRMVKSFRSRGWHKDEPCQEYPQEKSQMFEQMAFHALAEDLITESKAAELLAVPLMDFHALRNMERADAAAYQ
jgi:hypothetical protein